MIPAASENLAETPKMTKSSALLARKQSAGSLVIDRTVLSVAWRRLMTRLVAACQEEQTHRGHSILLGVMKMPVHWLEPCSHARLDVTASVCALIFLTAICFLDGEADIKAQPMFQRSRCLVAVVVYFNAAQTPIVGKQRPLAACTMMMMGKAFAGDKNAFRNFYR